MCLTPESHARFSQLARNLDDEKFLELDASYRKESRTSVEWELHGIVMNEIHQRRKFRRNRLERSLWLSTRRGRFIEAVKGWLIDRGLWSSAVPADIHTPSLVNRVLMLLWGSSRRSQRLSIDTLPGRQTPLEQL
jgi:hypothetical protein